MASQSGARPAVPRNAPATGSNSVPGTTSSWHTVVLWFLGAMALLALASPAPNIATMIVVLLIVGALLQNWSIYGSYLGLFGPGNLTNPTQQKAAPSALSNS